MANYYYELRVSLVAGGQYCQMVFNYVIDLPTPPEDFTAASQLVATLDDGGAASWISLLMLCCSEDVFLSSVRARQISPNGGNTRVIVFEPTDEVGGVAEPVAAMQLAGCIIFVNSVDPDRTGRTFVPGVPKTFLEGSRWTPAAIAAYEAFGNKVTGGLVAPLGTFNAITLDRDTMTGPLVDGCYLSPKPGTQRKRELPV